MGRPFSWMLLLGTAAIVSLQFRGNTSVAHGIRATTVYPAESTLGRQTSEWEPPPQIPIIAKRAKRHGMASPDEKLVVGFVNKDELPSSALGVYGSLCRGKYYVDDRGESLVEYLRFKNHYLDSLRRIENRTSDLEIGCEVKYSKLRTGDVIPGSGVLYRVGKLRIDRDDGPFLLLERVDFLPEMAGYYIGFMSVPLVCTELSDTNWRRGIGSSIGPCRYFSVKVNQPASGLPMEFLSATLSFSKQNRIEEEDRVVFKDDSEEYWHAVVKVGDVLMIRHQGNTELAWYGHRVIKIVAPDKDRQIIGWVELDSTAIPEAQLVKDGYPVVRPEPKRFAAPQPPIGWKPKVDSEPVDKEP